jgi:hypothetical protein
MQISVKKCASFFSWEANSCYLDDQQGWWQEETPNADLDSLVVQNPIKRENSLEVTTPESHISSSHQPLSIPISPLLHLNWFKMAVMHHHGRVHSTQNVVSLVR